MKLQIGLFLICKLVHLAVGNDFGAERIDPRPTQIMNLIIWTILSAVLSSRPVHSAQEEITEDYIQKFSEGVEELKRASQYGPFNDETFDPLKYDEQAAINNAKVYDFIVVGAGAAGSVIASRLSEVPEWKILLLEAGDVESPYAQVPGFARFLQNSKYNWGYVTEPQHTWCLGMVEKKCTAATGKALGGGTSVNGMMHTRGNHRDYDLWSDQGNLGWCYKDVLPYFKKAEDCALTEFDPKYHNQGGPLHVEEAQYVFPFADTFLSAGEELGYKVVDYNGKEQIGFSKPQTCTKHGRRNSAARSYLEPYINRKNLHIKPLSQAIQILIKTHTKEAFGVKYIHNNTMYIAKAAKEVIVSAGAFNSAQLLMLSGIGPQEDLEKLQIPVIENLKVGRQLKDHIAFQGPIFLLNISKVEEPNPREQLATWLKYGTGLLAKPVGQALAYIKTGASKDQAHYPDVELILSTDEDKSVLEPSGNYVSLGFAVMPTHPKSVGTIKLKSKDPFHGPVIDLNHLSDSDEDDIQTMLAGIKRAIDIMDTRAFQKLGAHLYTEPVKDCEHFGFASDDYWKCAARYLSFSLRHYTGTCKMGPRSDQYAVVDNELKVYGIHKLRVADSSIIPVSITGHTHAATNMVGEKAADLIKEYWK